MNIKVYTFEKPGDTPVFSGDRNILCLDDIRLEWDRAYIYDEAQDRLLGDITEYHACALTSIPRNVRHVAFLFLSGR